MKELKKLLEKLSEQIKEMTEVVEISKKFPKCDINDMILQKRIEDGFLKNLHNANEKQLIFMRDSYRWSYYREDKSFGKPEKRVENTINQMILIKKREQKFKRIMEE